MVLVVRAQTIFVSFLLEKLHFYNLTSTMAARPRGQREPQRPKTSAFSQIIRCLVVGQVIVFAVILSRAFDQSKPPVAPASPPLPVAPDGLLSSLSAQTPLSSFVGDVSPLAGAAPVLVESLHAPRPISASSGRANVDAAHRHVSPSAVADPRIGAASQMPAVLLASAPGEAAPEPPAPLVLGPQGVLSSNGVGGHKVAADEAAERAVICREYPAACRCDVLNETRVIIYNRIPKAGSGSMNIFLGEVGSLLVFPINCSLCTFSAGPPAAQAAPQLKEEPLQEGNSLR